MVIELTPQSFPCLPALFSKSEHHLVIRSIAAGHNPARAWIDDATHPTAALVWDRMGGLYLAGQSERSGFTRALRDLITDSIVPNARERWIPEMEVFYDQPGWEPLLKSVLPDDLQPRPAVFNSYRLAQPQAGEALPVPPGFQVLPVTRDMLASHGLGHLEHLTGWILSFYHNLTTFLETGFGCVTVDEVDQSIASLCITVFVAPAETGSGQDYELGLATAPEYRRRGLAGAVAAASVRRCLLHGDTPVWHCWADNTPSALIAEKVGFELLRQTPAVRFNTGAEG